jgi:hypothetical protein
MTPTMRVHTLISRCLRSIAWMALVKNLLRIGLRFRCRLRTQEHNRVERFSRLDRSGVTFGGSPGQGCCQRLCSLRTERSRPVAGELCWRAVLRWACGPLAHIRSMVDRHRENNGEGRPKGDGLPHLPD